MLEEHAKNTAYLPANVWLLTRIPCPLLKDSKCSVYDVRPFQCRATWALADPYYCHGQRFGERTSLVARGEVTADFVGYQRMLAQQAHTKLLFVPISRAILWAHRLATGELTLEALVAAMLDEFREAL
jgi:hypothetical protein